MILIAGAIALVIMSAWRGGFSLWFSNPATHPVALGTKEASVSNQEPDQPPNVEERKLLTLEPKFTRLSGRWQEWDPIATGIDSKIKAWKMIAKYEIELALDPNNGTLHLYMATALQKAGRGADAIPHYSEAIRLDESNYIALNNLAWIRASHPDPKLRDGTEAVRLAKQACELTGYRKGDCLDTLSIAYAEAQQFTDAISTAEKGLALAKAAKEQTMADEIQARLTLYRAGKPYREAARPEAPAASEH